MNQNKPDPDFSNLNERVGDAVGAHRRKMKLMTGTAFLFGFLAIAVSLLLVFSYFILYLPKQRQMLYEFSSKANMPGFVPSVGTNDVPSLPKNDFAATEVVMTHVISFGTMLVALSVGLSAAGTLVMLALVILQRRTTLQQINVSLSQISNQLKELQLRDNR